MYQIRMSYHQLNFPDRVSKMDIKLQKKNDLHIIRRRRTIKVNRAALEV